MPRWTKESYNMLQNNCQHFSAYMSFRWLLHSWGLYQLLLRMPSPAGYLLQLNFLVPSSTSSSSSIPRLHLQFASLSICDLLPIASWTGLRSQEFNFKSTVYSYFVKQPIHIVVSCQVFIHASAEYLL